MIHLWRSGFRGLRDLVSYKLFRVRFTSVSAKRHLTSSPSFMYLPRRGSRHGIAGYYPRLKESALQKGYYCTRDARPPGDRAVETYFTSHTAKYYIVLVVELILMPYCGHMLCFACQGLSRCLSIDDY